MGTIPYALLLIGGFAALVAGALVFTNAAEWAGVRRRSSPPGRALYAGAVVSIVVLR